MKIFSLETKKHLVGWSLVVGMVISLIMNQATIKNECPDFGVFDNKDGFSFIAECWVAESYGWPYRFYEGGLSSPVDYYKNFKYVVNYVFYCLISLIILSTVRHFRKRNNQNILNKG